MSKSTENRSENGSHSISNLEKPSSNFSNNSEDTSKNCEYKKDENIPSMFIPDDVIDDCLEEWKYNLIGRLDFVKLKLKDAEASLRQQWTLKGNLQLIPLGKGFFIIKLDNFEDRSYIWKVLWVVEKQNLKLRAWEPNFNLEAQKSTSAFVWEIGYYASVLVGIDLAKYIPSKIWVTSKYGRFEQALQIPKLPKLCNHCQALGHYVAECRNKRKETTDPTSVTNVLWEKPNKIRRPKTSNTQENVGFDICFPRKGPDNSQTHPAESFNSDDKIDAIIPPILHQVKDKGLKLNFITKKQAATSSSSDPKKDFVVIGSKKNQGKRSPKASQSHTPHWNIRGLRRTKATDKIRSLVYTFGPSLFWLAEPKISVRKDTIKKLRLSRMKHLVIHNSYESDKRNIWLLWSSSISDPILISNTKQEITVEIGGSLITGVNAASLAVDRRFLWDKMLEINNQDKPWLVIGDFNAVLNIEEKKGGRSPLKITMLEFNNYIQSYGLIQAPKTGLEFSWCNNRAGAKRILHPSWVYKVGARWLYDHGVLYGDNASIPKPLNVPFRAFKDWLEHEDFLKLVEDYWKNQVINDWNWNVFGDIKRNLKKAEDVVLKASLDSDRIPHNIALLDKLVTARGEQELLNHQIMKWQTKNSIVELENSEGSLITSQQGISNILVSYFEEKFKYQETQIVENIFSVVPQEVNSEDNNNLESTPSAEETKKVVFDMDSDSAPGPDGFSG
ncbi:uncharacterized protein LOC113290860 [Papaver somniferum]|uniref:uncharacterized protein LOC113290860 n=1 Tax=Papaver somniferum TaxID=3469 RepID=UPI000E6FB2BD|nr:uncharacterized protein LOC113290860 [Papaver somniferum]